MTRRTPHPAGQESARRAWTEAQKRTFREVNLSPLDAFALVAEAYRRQFHREVWIWRMDMDRLPVLTAAMQTAMQAGEPLTCDEATAITGISPPPLGAVG